MPAVRKRDDSFVLKYLLTITAAAVAETSEKLVLQNPVSVVFHLLHSY